MSARLRVVFVGGAERIERELAQAGRDLGLDVCVHDGKARGKTMERLATLVRGSDVVVLVTGINSHGAVHTAKRAAEKAGARIHILKFCGAKNARAMLAEIAHAGAA